METDSPEIRDDEKTTAQIISELRDEIAGLKHEVEETKRIPSTKEAHDALGAIKNARATADGIMAALDLAKKNAAAAQAHAETASATISALLKSAQEVDSATRTTLEGAVKALRDQLKDSENSLNDSKVKLKDQQDRVEALIPGATSAKLASAFKERKEKIAEGNWGWVVLLILAALGLVTVGIVSIVCPGDHFWTTLPARAVVVVGLFFIEEFARRNYNIKVRLAEAYGYKEVLSRSFYGYKNEVKGLKVPGGESGSQLNDADAILVRTFLDALGDEPGRNIFDKEKSASISERLVSRLIEAKADDDSLLSRIVGGHLLSRVSWPLVVIFGIGMVGACLIVFLNK